MKIERRSGEPPFSVYAVCYVVLGLLLLYALVFRWFRPVVLEDPIQVQAARVAQIEQRVDPNFAGWAELARLPGVGEGLARRIVAYREEQRRATDGGGAAIVFRTAEDLDAVPGIGPKTLERIRPYLRFPQPTGASSQPDRSIP